MTRDLLRALRWLRRNPLFTAAVTAILALGIGANTAVFSIVDAVLLRTSFADEANLVRVEEISGQGRPSNVSVSDYLLWRGRTDLFTESAAHLRDIVTITGVSEPSQVNAERVTGDLFHLLRVHARLGRTPAEADFRSGNPAVLSDRLWRRLFHADPAVLGRNFTASGELFTVIGVMPAEFEFPRPDIEMWLPLRLDAGSTWGLLAVARKRPEFPLARLQSAMDVVAAQMARTRSDAAGLRIAVSTWRDDPGAKYETTLVLILAAVGLVLLIACADVGGLLLSRALKRQKELAIRASLGAGFWRVLRQLLAESLLLAVLGSAAGIAVAHLAMRSLARQAATLPVVLPHLASVAVNERVLLFNTILCLILACLFSIGPVLLASKTDLQLVLRGGTMGGPGGGARWFAMLIACEAALSFLLLVGSGLMIRSLIRLEQSDHGINPDHVLTARVPIGTRTQTHRDLKYDTRPRQIVYYRELLEQLTRMPGIRAVAIVNNPPLTTVNTAVPVLGPDGQTLLVSTRTVSEQYFQAMGTPLLAGRAFTAQDDPAAPRVAILNQTLARRLFPGGDVVGRNLPSSDAKSGALVVGVVKDAPQMSYERPPEGELYLPYQQIVFGAFMSTVIVRTSGDPLAVAPTLQKAIWAVDPDQPVVQVETLKDVIADSIWRPRFSAWIFSVLGIVALALTSAGVYSVVTYTTALRARELGIRVALGATPRGVAAVVLRGTMVPLTAGLAASFAAALFLSRLMASLLYGVGSADPLTYAGAALLLLSIGAAASLRPAWRAAHADPLPALRAE